MIKLDEGSYIWGDVSELIKIIDPDRVITLISQDPRYLLYKIADQKEVPGIRKALKNLDPGDPSDLLDQIQALNWKDQIFKQIHRGTQDLDEVSQGALITGEVEGDPMAWDLDDDEEEGDDNEG